MQDQAGRLAELQSRNEILEAQLALYREAVEHMHQGLCVLDPDGSIALYNSRYPQVLALPESALRPGLTPRELVELGMQAGNYAPGKTADELERGLWANLAAEEDKAATLIRGDRTYSVHPRRTASGRYVATFADITAQVTAEGALRDSEERLKSILDALPDCVKIFAPAGGLIHINPKGLELLQAKDIESLSAAGYSPVPEEYLDEVLSVHGRVLGGETVVWTAE